MYCLFRLSINIIFNDILPYIDIGAIASYQKITISEQKLNIAPCPGGICRRYCTVYAPKETGLHKKSP